MTGFSSSIPSPDPALSKRETAPGDLPHAGEAKRATESPRPHSGSERHDPAFDASMHRPGPLPPNPAYEEFQREYAARYAPYSEPVVSRRRGGFRAVHMALIFVLGATAGLTGAWWADSSGQQPAAMSPVPGIVSSKPDLPPYEKLVRRDGVQGAAQGTRGIRSGELPYDGKPPEEADDVLSSAPPVLAAAPLSSAAISSGGSEEESTDLAPQAAPSGSASKAETEKKSSALSGSVKDSRAASSGRAAGPADSRPREVESKTSAPTVTPAAPKRTAVAKNAKEQEIERIRRQADDELKRKNSAAQRADEARTASRVAQKTQPAAQSSGQSSSALSSVNNVKVMLARCEAASNIFLREQCKWKLCNGMWGKNGCPSYAKPNSNYNY